MVAKQRRKKAAASEEPKLEQMLPNPSEANDALPPTSPECSAVTTINESPRTFVVGLVASTGGLDAFKRFFAAMPFDSGIAFVLALQLDPAYRNLLGEMLVRTTTLPILEAENDMPVKANHIYITPPNKYMTIHGGILHLTASVDRRAAQTSIDLFLRSLAEDQEQRSICIILSGTGVHGTLGLKAIKAASGLVMVQDPSTAECEQMPQSAIATKLADYVLPAEQMPGTLVKYVQHGYLSGGPLIEAGPEAADNLLKVLDLLWTHTKFNFRCYRKKMLMRRIRRRMGLNHFEGIHEYVAFLQEHPEEVKQLFRDLLISVTSFFRDPEAFEQLSTKILAPLMQHKEANDVIRVWVPGCATGKEAYSIAMLLLEQLEAAHKNCRVQIIATDVNTDALDVARQSLYPDSISVDVSPERLARFFTKVGANSYQVNKTLRESVMFAVHNLVTDAPFTKLDLICCRNLLIYFEPDIQTKVLTLFHYVLKEGGFLFLGPSGGTISAQIDLFEPVLILQR